MTYAISTLFNPRNGVLFKLREEFFVIQQAGDNLGMALCSSERVMRFRLLGDATIEQYSVEIERRMLFERVNRRSKSPLDHVHPRKAVAVDGAVRKRPSGMFGARGGRLQNVAVKRHVLPRQCAVGRTFRPRGKFVDKIGLRLFR